MLCGTSMTRRQVIKSGTPIPGNSSRLKQSASMPAPDRTPSWNPPVPGTPTLRLSRQVWSYLCDASTSATTKMPNDNRMNQPYGTDDRTSPAATKPKQMLKWLPSADTDNKEKDSHKWSMLQISHTICNCYMQYTILSNHDNVDCRYEIVISNEQW